MYINNDKRIIMIKKTNERIEEKKDHSQNEDEGKEDTAVSRLLFVPQMRRVGTHGDEQCTERLK